MQNMLEMLKQQFPAALMPELAQQTQGCLQDILDAFPNAQRLPTGHLNGLVSAVESLLRISDYQRRRILHHMKRSQSRSAPPHAPCCACYCCCTLLVFRVVVQFLDALRNVEMDLCIEAHALDHVSILMERTRQMIRSLRCLLLYTAVHGTTRRIGMCGGYETNTSTPTCR